MTTVNEIEKAVADLPLKRLSTFRSWFKKFDAACWDKQLEKDIKAGKLNALAQRCVRTIKKVATSG